MSILTSKPLDVSTIEAEKDHTALQLQVAVIINSNPILRQYLTLMGEDKVHSVIDAGIALQADPHKYQVRLASITGELGAYKHLLELASLEADLLQKCDQLSQLK